MRLFRKEISVRLKSHPKGRIPLGDVAEFRIMLKDKGVEYRPYLGFREVFYLRPLADWTSEPVFRYYPEAPGRYFLAVEWRAGDGTAGWKETPFEVVLEGEGVAERIGPTWVLTEWGARILAPTAWESTQIPGHEESVAGWLAETVKTGWVVYDIGASVGQHALLFSRLVGKSGQVYCIEANPINVHFLRLGLQASGRENVRIFPVALKEGSESTVLQINYGNLTIGVTGESYLYSIKVGHEITVPGIALDALIDRFRLKPPDLLKVDIEGAEVQSIAGMMQTILKWRPVIVLETHGAHAVDKCMRLLDTANYRYRHLGSGMEFSDTNEALSWYPGSVQIFGCAPGPRD